MRNFKFFASMALVALASACTNDDLQMDAPVTPGQDRPTTNFVIDLDEAIAQTRAAYGQGADGSYKWQFEDGDKLGAMLMDEWDGLGENISNFHITDYAQTNYPFTRDASGRWSAHEDLNTLAGNYFFYFPYAPVNNARGHFGFSVNPVQPQYNENGDPFPYQPVVDNQKYVGYSFVPVNDGVSELKLVPNLVPVFAQPTFQFVNKTGAELIVHKVAIRVTEDGSRLGKDSDDEIANDVYRKDMNELLATTMALTPAKRGFERVRGQWLNTKESFDKEQELMWEHVISYTDGAADEKYIWPKGVSGQEMDWVANKRPFYALSEEYKNTYLQAPAYEYVADFTGVTGGYKVKPFNRIQALLVMPAGYYYAASMEALIYVSPVGAEDDDYVVRVPLNTDSYVSDDVASIAGHNFLRPGKITKFLAEFDAAGMQSYDITKAQITSSEDLMWLIQQAEKHVGDYNMVVSTSGKRVVLTKEIEDRLNALPNLHLYVNGKITIAADASSNAINKLHFSNNGNLAKVRTHLTILNKQVATKDIFNCDAIIVKKEGALITDKNVTADKVENAGEIKANVLTAEVYNTGIINATTIVGDVDNNKGTVKVARDITGDVANSGVLEASNIFGYAQNSGTLTVTGKVTEDVQNRGTATINTVEGFLTNNIGATATVNTTAEFNNYGKLNLKGSNTIIAAGYNEGSIDIKGAYTVESLINKGSVDVNADVTVLATGGVIENVKGTITVNATVYAKEDGIVNNYTGAVINVNGKLAEEVKNSGEIFVKGNGKVIVNGNLNQDVKGIIDVTEATGAEADAQKAMDYVTDEAGNAFRYVVKESANSSELKAALLARISSNNFTTNDIIVLFDAKKSIKYYGKYVNNPIPNIAYVKVVNGTTLTITDEAKDDTNFPQLDAENSQTVPEYKPFEVENGATLIVADHVTLTIPEVDVWVNGVFNVNDHAVLKGAALVKGNGVTISTTAASNREWALDGTDWTGKATGWN